MRGWVYFAAWLLVITLGAPASLEASPKIKYWQLDNGARVYFVEARELPMMQLRVAFDAAGARDPKDKSGLAKLTNGMLNEGAGDLSTDEIAIRLEELGAELGTSSGRDIATVDLRTLTDPVLMEPALDVFVKVLSAPTFLQRNFERERARAVVAVAQENQSPGSVAQKRFMRTIYGNHPYAPDPTGDEESLKRITREDLVEHYQRYYVGRNALMVIVGDLSEAEAQRVARKTVGTLPAGAAAPSLPMPAPLASTQLNEIEFPSSQSHVLIGQPGITRSDPDYFPLYVGNYIFGGGGLVSRLSDEVREKRGLSYSVYSDVIPLRVPGLFLMSLQTRNAQRREANTVVRSTLDDFRRDGPTAEELQAAKKNITGGFPLRLDSNRKITEQVVTIAFYGLPLDYLEEFPRRVEAVTAAQIRDAFQRRIDPQRMATVIVGGKP
ncbi:MAG TPA: pitrilysin family protein [Burkholderiales bacterium]|nr:pitrilysin family protein [Burkholderiales bacterium]